MKDTIIKVTLGLVTVATGGVFVPIIPSDLAPGLSEHPDVRGYQYIAGSDRTDYRLVSTTTKDGTETMVIENHGPLPDADFIDDDGNGVISVGVFTDYKGNDVYKQIPDSQYAQMGQKNGNVYNPEASELISIMEAITPTVDAAIAVDTTSEGFQSSGTSLTFAHTLTGSDTAIVVSIFGYAGGDAISGATWNGSAMTQIGKRAADASGYQYLYGMATADTGTHNIVLSYGSTVQIFATAASYTGVSQSAPFPDTANANSASASSFSPTVTTSVDQSWVIVGGRSPSKGPTAGANTIKRKWNSTSGDAAWIYDSDAARSTGSNALNWSYTGASWSYYVMTSIAPAAAGGGGSTPSTTVQVILFE
jgi:hypothetical protein